VKIIAIECCTLTISVIKNAKSCLRLRSLPLSYMQKKRSIGSESDAPLSRTLPRVPGNLRTRAVR